LLSLPTEEKGTRGNVLEYPPRQTQAAGSAE
jgi:hypothetical protein